MAFRAFQKGGHIDSLLFAAVFLLVVVGLVMLVSASSELGVKRFGDPYYYLKQQLYKGILPGAVFFVVALFVYYRVYQKLALALFLISLFLALLVFSPLGHSSGGSERWLALGGPITFQPAELMKITFVLYLAAWLSNPRTNRRGSLFEGLLPLVLVTALAAGILVIQPATSTVAILVASGIAMYFLAGAKLRYVTFMVCACATGLVLLILFAGGYRLDRVKTFLGIGTDPLRDGYHVSEAVTTIGSGGLTGMGFGQSPAKSGRLPAVVNDSIFAIIASEFGFLGSAVIVSLFGFLVTRMLILARRMRDTFGRLVLAGFGVIIGIQVFVHIAALSGTLPLTGIPLPFISLGGTAMVVFLTMMGISLNISKYA